MWALGDEETRKAIEAAHERAIAIVLAWIEVDSAVIRYGTQGIHRIRPAHDLVAARFRHYETRSGMPLLHDHLLLSLKGLRPKDGVGGAVHSTALSGSAVTASALYNEVVMAEACEAMALASEPRTVHAGPQPSNGSRRRSARADPLDFPPQRADRRLAKTSADSMTVSASDQVSG
ncbi:relaxase domain-containing protein [Streptomyces sp. NPDC005374]|uniref:relaxase domain-containing protein n=1 Tax=Streptomyces sp. NPDC005374 TaxID=3364713 RepID=UPI0036CC547D